MALTLYEVKPRFQALLRPLVARFAAAGITANQVTIAAAVVSLAVGAFVFATAQARRPFLLIPLWMFLRMAFNAVDGMLAREFGQKSALGAYLNELTDVVADAALYLPFAAITPFGPWSVGAVILLASWSEMAGALAPMVGAGRRYDGPMGKSDRALVFGALGAWAGLVPALPEAAFWVLPAIGVLIALNLVQRVRRGVADARAAGRGA